MRLYYHSKAKKSLYNILDCWCAKVKLRSGSNKVEEHWFIYKRNMA